MFKDIFFCGFDYLIHQLEEHFKFIVFLALLSLINFVLIIYLLLKIGGI
jgi:hypothetical protein